MGEQSALSPDDRYEIENTLNRVAYVLDEHEYTRLGEVFASNIEFDNPGRLTASGLDAVIAAFQKIATPAISHHITNVVITPTDADNAECISKALTLRQGGAVTAAIYRDTVTRAGETWLITSRRITPLG